MVPTVLLILAPVLIGVIIFGTTILLSPSKKPNVNDTDLGNIATTAQFIATVLIPGKVATTVSLVFTTSPVIATLPPIVHLVTTMDTDPPATTTKTLTQKPVKEGPSSSPSPSKATSETTTTEEAAVVTALSSKLSPSTTTTTESPTPTKSETTISPSITIPNPVDLFKPVDPLKPIYTTADIDAITTVVAKEIPKPITTTTIMTATRATTSTTTTTTSPTLTRSGITIFPGISLPNPFDLFKPAEPLKSTNTTVVAAATTTTTTTVAKDVPGPTPTVTATTAVATAIAASPSPTKRPGFTLFPGITLPNPLDLFPHDHPSGEMGSQSHRLHPTKADEDYDDVENVRDGQNQDKTDADEDWEDEEVQHKGPIKTGSPQKVLRQRSLKRVRGHHYHRRSTQRAQLVRRQTLSLHDVIQIARNITVSPPVKTLHLASESSTTTTTAATKPTIPPHPFFNKDRKDTVIKDTDSNKEEKLSTPLQLPPTSNLESVPLVLSQGAQEPEMKDPVLQELESVIGKLVDAQTESFEEYLNLFINNLIQSDEIEPYQDLLFESIAVSKLEIPENNDDDSALDFDTDDQVDTLYSFHTSHPPSSDNNLVFQGPRAVSRFSIFTSILNTLLPPFILRFRADLRNFLFWICSPNASAHIDGRDASGDDTWARKVAQDDMDKLIHPDGSIDLMSIWDPSVGSLALECIKSHAHVFWNEVSSLVGTRFTQIKEVFVDQLRGLIGLPQFSGSTVRAENAMIDLPGQQQEVEEQQQQEEQVTKAKGQGTDTIPDLDIAGEYTQMEEPEFFSSSAPAITIAQEKTSSSPIHPNQHRKQGKPSPASDQALNLKANQITETTSDKADGFVKWFVDTVVNELQDGYFADAKVPAVFRVETQPSGSEDDGSREAGERICAWVKERVENVLQ